MVSLASPLGHGIWLFEVCAHCAVRTSTPHRCIPPLPMPQRQTKACPRRFRFCGASHLCQRFLLDRRGAGGLQDAGTREAEASGTLFFRRRAKQCNKKWQCSSIIQKTLPHIRGAVCPPPLPNCWNAGLKKWPPWGTGKPRGTNQRWARWHSTIRRPNTPRQSR